MMHVKNPPLLSLCIPIFCRASYLRETLESVMLSLQGFAEEIEILVSDNASTDHTSKVLAEFEARMANLHCTTNRVNLGAEMNFFHLLQKAKGKYIWILGDDDTIEVSLISVLMKRLRSDYDLVILNHSVHSKDFQLMHQRAMHPVSAPEHYEGKEIILSHFGPILSFISCVVIKRALLATISEEKFRNYAAYGLSFLYATYACLPQNATVSFIQQPLLRCRGVNSIIADYERVFIQGMALIFDDLAERHYSLQAISQAKKKVIRMYLLQYVVRCKLENSFSWKTIRLIEPRYSRCMPTYALLLLYATAPKRFIQMAKSLQKSWRALTSRQVSC